MEEVAEPPPPMLIPKMLNLMPPPPDVVWLVVLVYELLNERLVPSMVLLLYVTELPAPGGAYVTVSTTYFGSMVPVMGVGVGVGVGSGGMGLHPCTMVGVPPTGKAFGGGHCWMDGVAVCALRSCAENKHRNTLSRTFFFTNSPYCELQQKIGLVLNGRQ